MLLQVGGLGFEPQPSIHYKMSWHVPPYRIQWHKCSVENKLAGPPDPRPAPGIWPFFSFQTQLRELKCPRGPVLFHPISLLPAPDL